FCPSLGSATRMKTIVGGACRARTSSTVGTHEPISTLSSPGSITSKSSTAHQNAASRPGSWQCTTSSVNLLVIAPPSVWGPAPSRERLRSETAPRHEEHRAEEDEVAEELGVLVATDPLGHGAGH